MAFPHSKKELRFVFNHIENTCENLFKSFSNEAKKASAEFLLNPKKMDAEFTNWQVDLNADLEKLEELDSNFFNEVKGSVHAFEKSAKHLIKVYKNKPTENTGTAQFEYFKALQDAEEELKSILSSIFQTIKNLNF